VDVNASLPISGVQLQVNVNAIGLQATMVYLELLELAETVLTFNRLFLLFLRVVFVLSGIFGMEISAFAIPQKEPSYQAQNALTVTI
jgi:hypothetical protein